MKSESLRLASLSPGHRTQPPLCSLPPPTWHPASRPVPFLCWIPKPTTTLSSICQGCPVLLFSPEGPLREGGLPPGPGLRAVATGEGRARCPVLENSVKIPPHFSLWEKHTAAAQTEIKLVPSVTSDPWPRALPMTPPLNLTFTHPNHPIPRPSADS